MDVLKSVFKFMIASTLIVGGVLIGGTVLAAKKVDGIGDTLQQKLHGSVSYTHLTLPTN